MMSGRLRATSLTLYATALAHSVPGEVVVLRHLGRVQGLPPVAPWVLIPSPAMSGTEALARQSLRFSWHLPSIMGCAFALILGRYASRAELGAADRFVIRTIATALLLCAVAVFAATRGRHPGWAPLLAAVPSWTAAG